MLEANDLMEVLELYFDGDLDTVNDVGRLLTRGLRDLHLSNPLRGLLTNQEVYECLSEISYHDNATIRYYFTKDIRDFSYLLSLYAHLDPDTNFREWMYEVYAVALTNLGSSLERFID